MPKRKDGQPDLRWKNIIPGKRTCNACKESLDLTDTNFYRNKRLVGGLAYTCKRCHAGLNKQYARNNKERLNATGRKWRAKNRKKFKAVALASRHGIDRSVIQAAMDAESPCPYCEQTITWQAISVDHKDGKGSDTHFTCWPCNNIKGVFTDSDFRKIIAAIGGPLRLREYHKRVPNHSTKKAA